MILPSVFLTCYAHAPRTLAGPSVPSATCVQAVDDLGVTWARPRRLGNGTMVLIADLYSTMAPIMLERRFCIYPRCHPTNAPACTLGGCATCAVGVSPLFWVVLLLSSRKR